MYDHVELLSGLSLLGMREGRHAMRALLHRLGDRNTASFDGAIAGRALARLTPRQQDALTAYCRGFLSTEVRAKAHGALAQMAS